MINKNIEKEDFAEIILSRPIDEDYMQEWSSMILKDKEGGEYSEEISLLIFRLDEELLAISTLSLAEISPIKAWHTVPHRKGKNFLGLVNIRGQLRLCGSLRQLLDIGQEKEVLEENPSLYKRMLAVRRDGVMWVFPVSEVLGIAHLTPASIHNIPATIVKIKGNYLKGLIDWEGQSAGLLDDELVFLTLNRGLI